MSTPGGRGVFSRSRQRREQRDRSANTRAETHNQKRLQRRGSGATGSGGRWTGSLTTQRKELNQWNEVLHKLENFVRNADLDLGLRDYPAHSALSTGGLNELLDKLLGITYPCASITADGCGTMIALLCSSVPPTNDDLSSKLCQFVCILSSRQQQVMCRRNQLHTIIDFLIAYTSRCSSFFVKESLKAMGFILHEHGHKCAESDRSSALLELLLPYISLSQVDLEAKQAAMHCLANLFMHAIHFRHLFSQDRRSHPGSKHKECWTLAEDLIYENLKQHSLVCVGTGSDGNSGIGICRILISTLRAVTGMIAMGGFATAFVEKQARTAMTEKQLKENDDQKENLKWRLQDLMGMLKRLLVYGVQEDGKDSNTDDSNTERNAGGSKSSPNLIRLHVLRCLQSLYSHLPPRCLPPHRWAWDVVLVLPADDSDRGAGGSESFQHRQHGTIWLPLLQDNCDRCRVAAAGVLCTVMGDDKKLKHLMDEQQQRVAVTLGGAAARTIISKGDHPSSSSALATDKKDAALGLSKATMQYSLLQTYRLIPIAIAAESDSRVLTQLLRAATAAVTGHALALTPNPHFDSGLARQHTKLQLQSAMRQGSRLDTFDLHAHTSTHWPLEEVVALSQRLLLIKEEHAGIRGAAVLFLNTILGGSVSSAAGANGSTTGVPALAVAKTLQAQEATHEQQQQTQQIQQRQQQHERGWKQWQDEQWKGQDSGCGAASPSAVRTQPLATTITAHPAVAFSHSHVPLLQEVRLASRAHFLPLGVLLLRLLEHKDPQQQQGRAQRTPGRTDRRNTSNGSPRESGRAEEDNNWRRRTTDATSSKSRTDQSATPPPSPAPAPAPTPKVDGFFPATSTPVALSVSQQLRDEALLLLTKLARSYGPLALKRHWPSVCRVALAGCRRYEENARVGAVKLLEAFITGGVRGVGATDSSEQTQDSATVSNSSSSTGSSSTDSYSSNNGSLFTSASFGFGDNGYGLCDMRGGLELLTRKLPPALTDSSRQVRIAACGCFAAIGEGDWQKMWAEEGEIVAMNAMTNKKEHDIDSNRLGSGNGKRLLHSFINTTKDKIPGVRVAACRLLGAIASHRISKRKKVDIATPCAQALFRAMQDSNVNVRAKAVWGLANLFNDAATAVDKPRQVGQIAKGIEASTIYEEEDGMWAEREVNTGTDNVSEQLRPALCVDKKVMVSIVEKAIDAAIHDSDKVQSNAVRLLGYLCVHLLPCTAANQQADGVDEIKHEQEMHNEILSNLAHTLIQSVYPASESQSDASGIQGVGSDTVPAKVQWNACSASGLLLRASRYGMPVASAPWAPLLFQALAQVVNTSANYKVTITALGALRAPPARPAYGLSFVMLVRVLVSTLEKVEQQQVLRQRQQSDGSSTLMTVSQPAGGVQAVNQHSKTDATGTIMAGRGGAPYVEGSEEDFQQSLERELRYRVALRAHLWATLVHVMALATPQDTQDLREFLEARASFLLQWLHSVAANASVTGSSLPSTSISSASEILGEHRWYHGREGAIYEEDGGGEQVLGTGAEVRMGVVQVSQAVAKLRAGLPRLREQERQRRQRAIQQARMMQQAKAKQAEKAHGGAGDKKAASRPTTDVTSTARVSTTFRASSSLFEYAPRQNLEKSVATMSLQSENESSDEEL